MTQINRTAPCKGCTARTIGCHGRCEKYRAREDEHARWVKARNEEASVEAAIHDNKVRMMRTKQGGKRRRTTRIIKGV